MDYRIVEWNNHGCKSEICVVEPNGGYCTVGCTTNDDCLDSIECQPIGDFVDPSSVGIIVDDLSP